MIEFLKNLFKKKESEVEEIKESELKNWLGDKEKNIISEIEEQISPNAKKIESMIEGIRDFMKNLEKAELKNTNIPQREINFMKGNREAYLKIVDIFISDIKIPDKMNKIEIFISDYEKNIESFTRSSSKPYGILQHFFANESSKIASGIKKIDDLIKETKKIIERSNIHRFKDIENAIDDLKTKKIKKQSLDKESEEQKNILDKNKDKKEKVIKIIEEAKKSKEYEEILELKKEKDKHQRLLKEHEEDMTHKFAIIEKALKKYSKMALENQSYVEDYAEKALETLLDDHELIILDILKNLNAQIIKGKLDLKDKKKEKSIAVIEKMNKDHIKDFLEKHLKIKIDIGKIEKKMSKNLVLEQIKSNSKEVEFLDSEIERNTQRLEEIKMEKENIDISMIRKDIEEKIKENLNIILTIT